jgi:hypothetical protein
MTDINPYASPLSMDESIRSIEDRDMATLAERQEYEQGLFRKGKQLVMHRNATLPERCVKSNEPSLRYLRRNLSWHHPALYLTVFIGILLYVIFALMMRKQATVYIGLSEKWFRKRRFAILLGWAIALCGGAVMTVSLLSLTDPHGAATWGGWGILFGFLLGFGGILYGVFASQMIAPVRITKEYIWLKGVHPDFLADLPEWPYRP